MTDKAIKARQLLASGLKQSDIALQTGLSKQRISQIKQNPVNGTRDELYSKIIEQIKAGIVASFIAKNLGCKVQTVYHVARKNNLTLPIGLPGLANITDKERIEVEKLHSSGLNYKQIAAKTGLKSGKVNLIIRTRNPEFI